MKIVAFSLIGSIVSYALWYRLTVGPFCNAMWGGNAPILIIGISFITIYQIFKKVHLLKQKF